MTNVSRNLCESWRTFIVSRCPINIKQDLCFASSHQTDKNGDKTKMFLNTLYKPLVQSSHHSVIDKPGSDLRLEFDKPSLKSMFWPALCFEVQHRL